jgi:hypothetical protein
MLNCLKRFLLSRLTQGDSMRAYAIVAMLLSIPTGCIQVQQAKPLEVNINFSGRLDLVIHDARDDVERITGAKAQRVVNPEDIGLPASAPASGTRAQGFAQPQVALLASLSQPLASEDSLKQGMAGRNKAVRGLLDAKVAGEAHSGLLAARGTLTAPQKQLLDAENADRSALYAAEASRKKTSAADVGLAYYIARLGYAQDGDWYEKFNKATNAWEWKQWGQP